MVDKKIQSTQLRKKKLLQKLNTNLLIQNKKKLIKEKR